MAGVMGTNVAGASQPSLSKVALRSTLTSYRTTLLRLVHDDSGQALVEYCIIMATLTILMMVAYRSVGTVANGKANNNVTKLTNSSIVVP